jgi:hypothetical protein
MRWPLGLALVSLACGGGSPVTADAGTDAGVDAGTDAGVDAGVDAGPKEPIAGLIDMQDISWHNDAGGEPGFTIANVDQFPGIFGGIVINATWDSIEPAQDGGLSFTSIDGALAQIRTYNAANPAAPLGVKLRVYAGANAPEWAKELNGGPVAIQRNPNGCKTPPCPLTLGLFWKGEYIDAWRAFQSQLAARYDSEPLIKEIAITSCAQQTDEPFVPTLDATSKSNLQDAGYTDALQQDCLAGAVDDYANWKLTLIDYTFNPFTPLKGPSDGGFPETVMSACRASLGSRCVLDNHVLEAPLDTSTQPIYDEMAALGPPINFQTGSPQQMTCLWTQTIAIGVQLGAASIEVWPEAKFQGFDSFDGGNVAQLASEFVTPIDAGTPTPLPLPCSGFH